MHDLNEGIFSPRLQRLVVLSVTGFDSSLQIILSLWPPGVYLFSLVSVFQNQIECKTTKWRSTLKSIQTNIHKIDIYLSTALDILRWVYALPEQEQGYIQVCPQCGYQPFLHIAVLFHCLVFIMRWNLLSDEALQWTWQMLRPGEKQRWLSIRVSVLLVEDLQRGVEKRKYSPCSNMSSSSGALAWQHYPFKM